jgi:hypothetical protein
VSTGVIRLMAAAVVWSGALATGVADAGSARCVKWATVTITTAFGEEIHKTVCEKWTSDPGDSDPGVQPIVAPGGGSGGQSRCTSAPYGPISQVEEIWRSINRREQPKINDPGAPERSYFIGAWYRISPSSIQLRYLVTCVNPSERYDTWVTVTPTSGGGLAPQVTPEQLIPDAWARVQRQLPTPVPRIAPADLAPDGFAFVQMPAFFWVDQAPGQWEDVSATAAVAGLSLTVTAVPEQLVVTTGDGETLQCEGAPPAFPTDADPDTFAGCRHVYRHSSAMAPNGETYPVTVAIVWHATWQASNGQSGDLGTLTTTSTTRDLPVAEIQAVVTQG